MIEVEIDYDYLETDELRGSTQADYLVAIDAHLRLLDRDKLIFDEPGFPVVELARSLLSWIGDPLSGDFEFDSMSYEERGAIAIRSVGDAWVIGSVFAPEMVTSPAARSVVEECCRRFIARVIADLESLGLSPVEVLKL